MGALFGSLSALSIGFSDLFGRRVVRATSALTGSVAVSIVAAVTGILTVALFGSSMEPRDFVVGLLSGIGLGLGLATYYGGLMASSSTVVTPIVAVLSAVVPFVYAVARGAPASAFAVVGAAVAIGGLLLITAGGGGAHHVRVGVLWSIASGLAYGAGFAVVLEASSGAGALPVAGQRIASSTVLIALALRSREPLLPPADLRWSAVLGGSIAALSSVLFLIGARADQTAAVITASMFPVASVAIGRAFFGDAVSRTQVIGIAVVLIGVVGVVAG